MKNSQLSSYLLNFKNLKFRLCALANLIANSNIQTNYTIITILPPPSIQTISINKTPYLLTNNVTRLNSRPGGNSSYKAPSSATLHNLRRVSLLENYRKNKERIAYVQRATLSSWRMRADRLAEREELICGEDWKSESKQAAEARTSGCKRIRKIRESGAGLGSVKYHLELASRRFSGYEMGAECDKVISRLGIAKAMLNFQ